MTKSLYAKDLKLVLLSILALMTASDVFAMEQNKRKAGAISDSRKNPSEEPEAKRQAIEAPQQSGTSGDNPAVAADNVGNSITTIQPEGIDEIDDTDKTLYTHSIQLLSAISKQNPKSDWRKRVPAQRIMKALLFNETPVYFVAHDTEKREDAESFTMTKSSPLLSLALKDTDLPQSGTSKVLPTTIDLDTCCPLSLCDGSGEIMRSILTLAISAEHQCPENVLHALSKIIAINPFLLFLMNPINEKDNPTIMNIHKILSDAGIDINAVDGSGNTALYLAIDDGCTEMAQLLIVLGADVNAGISRLNQTTLHCAAMQGFLDITIKLLDRRSDVTVVDLLNKTALNYAVENKHAGVAQALVNHYTKLGLQIPEDLKAKLIKLSVNIEPK